MLETPQAIADKGEKIYREKYQAKYERGHTGKYLAIDIQTEQAYLGETPEEAIQNAQAANKTGLFHTVRIGFAGVYRLGYLSGNSGDWIFR